ncbi:hypothetical protein HZY93_02585 [Streptococcus danieliae]|uniref:Glycosyltransferase RgtA/B/C/D-like domain-containing protein n=1 Tax=Streptococcus danieliae TaxID=747656 RepID=A0A7Z0LCH6_9STRE|nr:hypothetical protein [Streptococcus danieliae]NYS48871.1 hypothetical protein [Streptococcus danieliae]
MKKIGDGFLKYRYLIALLLFIVGVSFQLHGSSISNWNNYGISETSNHTRGVTINDLDGEAEHIDVQKNLSDWISLPPRSDGTIAGVPRMIRSDEWLVQTPFYLAQANSGNLLNNPNYALSGQNMIVAYNSPVWHISVLGKPFNWGFLFFSAATGLSWYWCFKILAMLLLAYEFSLILTKQNKWLSSIGALWITFTPAIQWWFMQHLGDVVFYTLLMTVSIYHYFHQENRWFKLLMASFLVSAMIGFVLVIYPAFQIPFAYLVGAFFVIEFWKAIRTKKLQVFDWLSMGLTLLVAVSIIGYSLWVSKDALNLTLNTVYPGSRTSVGGGFTLAQFIEFLQNVVLPFRTPNYMNQVELATSFQFVWSFLLTIPFVVKKEQVWDNIFGLFLVFFTTLLAVYAFVEIPEIISKATLFSFVTSNRAWQAAAVSGVFASLWFIGLLFREKSRHKLSLLLGMVPALVLSVFLINNQSLDIHYISSGVSFITLGLFSLTYLLFIFRRKMALLPLLGMILVSGMTVNPVVQGLDVIDNKVIALEVKQLKNEYPEALWMTENGYYYQLPQMLGAKSIDGVRFYPDIELMKALDPTSEMEEQWNRYSHMRYLLVDEETSMENPSPDVLKINLAVEDLEKLQVRYIISNRNLPELFGENRFRQVYGPDLDGNRIFEVIH